MRQELKDKADEKGTRDSDEGVRFRVFLSSQNFTSGMWLLVYMAHKIYKLAPAEFLTSCCRRNTVVNPFILREKHVNGELLQQTMVCTCAGGNRPQPSIDLFGNHILQCPNYGTPTRVHDTLVHMFVMLLRTLGLAVSLEPIGLFDNVNADDNRRPDILIHNPYVNSTPPTASSSDQCDDILNANHESAQRFMEDMELAVLNQDHTQI